MKPLNDDKKNLIILHVIVGLGDGGAEGTLYRLVSSDKINKHIIVSLTSLGKYGDFFSNIDVPVYSLNFKKNRLNIIKLFRLIKIVNLCDPNIIQSWMYHADFISTFIKIFNPKIKLIWGIRNTVYKFKDSVPRYIISKLCSILSHIIPKFIISCSDKAAEEHIMIGYNKKKIKVIHNGVNLDKFNNIKTHQDLKDFNIVNLKDKQKPVFGMVARYDKQKGHEILFKSLNYLKNKNINFYCYLVGTNINDKNEELVTLIEKYKLTSDIFLLGQRGDVEKIYSLFDLTVLSSINGEGFPNVLIESMSCETPCVATDVGDSRYIIDNTGWIVKPNDFKDLAKSLEKAISEINHTKWLKRKKECRERIKDNFSIKIMKDKFQNIWSNI